MGKIRHDWPSIRQEYANATPPISQADLCRKYGIDPTSMCRRAKAENWDFDRERFNSRLSEQKSENKAVAVASEGQVFDSESLRFAKKGLALADKFLDKKDLDPRVMKDVLAAGRTAQQIAKDAMGDKPPEQTFNVKSDETLQAIVEWAGVCDDIRANRKGNGLSSEDGSRE